jgi:hypothetical protein
VDESTKHSGRNGVEPVLRRRLDIGAVRAASCRPCKFSRKEKPAVQGFYKALFRTRTGDPLLTMERLAQLVAAGGNRFGLFLRVWDPVDLPLIATG